MPIQGTPIEVQNSKYKDWILTPDDIRMFMRDYPNMNVLLADREFSDSEIERAFTMAISQGNIVGRPTSYTTTTFPNAYVLQLGVVAYLLRMESFRQLRNQSQFQDGNIQGVGIDTKQSDYLQQSAQLNSEFQSMLGQIKINENMNTFGMMKSPSAQTAYIR
jgi:hypothetical protein